MKVLAVFGTRPEAIKMCPLVKELHKCEKIELITCITGQHDEMVQQVLEVFDISVNYNLKIMKENQTLILMTIHILEKFDEILEKEKPGIILVHGDTTSAMACAMAGFYRKIPIGHVEAGLRTYDIYSPYPEEFNRQMIDIISKFYFVPTKESADNLLNEGKNKNDIYITGNTVIDALKTTVNLEYKSPYVQWIGDSKLLLLTMHRRENIGKPMQDVFRAIKRIISKYHNVKVIYPVHLNPNVREIAYKELGEEKNILLIEPVNPLEFHNLINISYLVLTDSGGIQEEAPALGKPVLVLRNTTERIEGVSSGTLKLIGTDTFHVYDEIVRLIEDRDEYERMSNSENPYGDGKASKKILDILLNAMKK